MRKLNTLFSLTSPTSNMFSPSAFVAALSVNAIAPCAWTTEESEVESSEHQHNTNIHCQPFPESVSEEREIYSDYDGYHRHCVKQDGYLSVHFRFLS